MSAIGNRSAFERTAHFIGGEWSSSTGETHIDVEDPATGAVIGTIAAGTSVDVDAAVRAAQSAMAGPKWSPTQRQDALLALANTILANADELAELERLDAGKPITNAARVDVPAAAAILRYFAGWATKLTGETVELSQPGAARGYTLREPVGVVGQIIPWNYPLMGAAFKIGPALAAGCAVVLKPAEQTSLSALRLAELSRDCGIPAGFLNVVTGYGADVGAALVAHPFVQKISFTGSTQTGQLIAADCARSMKRVTVELGGKSPVLVMPDADLESAARAIGMSIFFNTGQTCSAGSRLLVHSSVADDLLQRIAAYAVSLKMGPTLDPATQLGPTISGVQRARVEGYIESALRDGAKPYCGGSRHDGPGHYVAPTVFCGLQSGMAAVDEEIFGPVLCAMTFDTLDLDEIAALANDTRYGLAAYAFTQNLSWANGLTDRLRAGTVRINACGGSDISLPSGGMKDSGFGRENGRAGVESYTELKTVTVHH